jgi:hypothetical protein
MQTIYLPTYQSTASILLMDFDFVNIFLMSKLFYLEGKSNSNTIEYYQIYFLYGISEPCLEITIFSLHKKM